MKTSTKNLVRTDNANVDYSSHLLDMRTNEFRQTDIKSVTRKDIIGLKRKGWLFNWLIHLKDGIEVKQLIFKDDGAMQGLVAFEELTAAKTFFVHLVESAPHNRGTVKLYDGAGSHLFAYVAKRAADKGYNIIYFDTKTLLMPYYSKKLGAQQIGRSKRMYVDGDAFVKLIKKFYGGNNNEKP